MPASITNWEGLLQTTRGLSFLINVSGIWSSRSRLMAHGSTRVQIKLWQTYDGYKMCRDDSLEYQDWKCWKLREPWEYSWHLMAVLKKNLHYLKLVCLSSIFSLRNSILRKLAYLLLVTTFTEQQCTEIMQPILSTGLPKIRYIHTMPHAIVQGPLQLSGLNIPNFYMEQLVSQLGMVTWYGSQLSDTMGLLIWAVAESMKLEMGLAGKILRPPSCLSVW